MSIPPKIPPWLKDHQSLVPTVFNILKDRELSRRNAYRTEYNVSVGHHNMWGNRYSDIMPYDRTRVVVSDIGVQDAVDLEEEEPHDQGRYLNASWVREAFGGKWWIAAQAPLLDPIAPPRDKHKELPPRNTAHAFLSVILQSITRPPHALDPSPLNARTCQIRTVVQLTVNGIGQAHPYFPEQKGSSQVILPENGADLPSLKVTLLERKVISAHCVQSTVSIIPISTANQESEPVTFRHLLYTAWPDHGVPAVRDRASLLAFIRFADQSNKDTSNLPHNKDLHPDPPIIVNCSAGVGRTGCFIALSSLLRSYDLLPSTQQWSLPTPLPASPLGVLPSIQLEPQSTLWDDRVAQEVDSLREQRPGMVQREVQLLLIYQVLESAFGAVSAARLR